MITTRSEARRAIRSAETIAALLVQPGFATLGRGERRKIAAVLTDLAQLGRRAFDPFARWDAAVEPADLRDVDDAVITDVDLFGGAA